MNQRIFFSFALIPSWDQTPFFNSFLFNLTVFFPLLPFTKAKLIACENVFCALLAVQKGTKGWKHCCEWVSEWVRETKVHFVIFCNWAQFLMKASQSSLLYTTQWNGSMNAKIYDENKISNFHVSHSLAILLFPVDFICCHSISHPRPCIKYRKLLKST
jgi:hypothetical protein